MQMTDNKPERAADALGMPVPPVWAARGANWLRNALGRAHTHMVPGFAVVLERLFGIVDNKALYCAVELEIPDLLVDGPRSAAEIAQATNADADADAVDRLLRYLVSRDLFTRARDGRYLNNGATAFLRKNHPYSWRDWVLFFGSDWNWQIWNQMPTRIREGRSAAQAALGMDFFEYVNRENAKARGAFNGAMAAGARLQSLLFTESVDLSGYRHVCDVGGGTGTTLVRLLRAHAGLQGTVLDLPELEQEARTVFESAGVADRARFAGGDFFQSVPQGCDLYTLFAVIHDWDDDRCVRILGNIRGAMAPAGRIMIIEKPVRAGAGHDFAKASDMLMLVLGKGGRERTESEYESMFKKAGLDLRRQVTLPSLFDVFELLSSR